MAAKKSARRTSNLWLHGGVWWCRVRMDGVVLRVSTGAQVEAVAVRRRDLFETLVEHRKHRDLCAGVMGRRISLAELHDAYHTEGIDALRVQATSVDLAPLVEAWLSALTADAVVRPATIKEYRQKVGSLITPGTPYFAARLTPEAVRSWLRGLDVSTATKRHYFDALRAYVRWLVTEREVWKVSPLAGMEVPKLSKPRDRHLTGSDVLACLDAVTTPESREMLTLIAGTGMELSAIARLAPRDVIVGQQAVWARGTKTGYRDRVVFVRSWAWQRVSARLRAAIGAGPVYHRHARLLRQDWYDAQRAALGLEPGQYHTIHDLRHTYCFLVLTGDDGESVKDLQWCADQLGHADTMMVSRIYGKYRLRERVALELQRETATEVRIEDAPNLKVMG